MLYIIGLGLNSKSISKQGLEAISKCKRIYLETYTVNFPYSKKLIKDLTKKKIVEANREKVEGLSLIDEAKKLDVALLVYGSPLFATTHITLVSEAKASRVKCKVIYNTSVFDALGETGLQLYKFGKIASMPGWKKSYEPNSFMEIVKENQSIEAHSLILVDIGLKFQDALEQLIKSAELQKIKLPQEGVPQKGTNKIIVCQCLGTKNSKIIYKTIDELKEFRDVSKPYCLIIPGKLHFVEKEFLEKFE